MTVGQFRQFVDAAHYATDAERDDAVSSPASSKRQGPGGYGYNAETGKLDEDRNPKHNWRNVGFPQTDNHPVTNVSWNDAVKFCKWLSEKEQKTYRLPTEAEWEYACRAGTKTRFWSGDDPEGLVKIANTYDKSTEKIQPEWAKFALKGDDGFEFTAPVGSFQPNAFGLYDMHGNVWQWVSDFYSEDYYAQSPVDDPQGPPPSGKHVRRGGGWATWSFYCRSSFRNYNTPQSRYFNLGFRVVMESAIKWAAPLSLLAGGPEVNRPSSATPVRWWRSVTTSYCMGTFHRVRTVAGTPLGPSQGPDRDPVATSSITCTRRPTPASARGSVSTAISSRWSPFLAEQFRHQVLAIHGNCAP